MTVTAPAGGRAILALMTEAYGCLGGIAVYNRDVLGGLAADSGVDRVIALPRWAPGPLEPIPAKVAFDQKGLGGIARFARRALVLIREGNRETQIELDIQATDALIAALSVARHHLEASRRFLDQRDRTA